MCPPPPFLPPVTSYDYDAPVQEGGGHGYGHDGDKFDAIRRIIGYWSGTVPPVEPPAPIVTAYGAVKLSQSAGLWNNLDIIAPVWSHNNAAPPTLEALGGAFGYALYSTWLPAFKADGKGDYSLSLSVSDYASVYLDGGLSQGIVWRPSAKPVTLDSAHVFKGSRLDILVESMGHINYGRGFFDPKGVDGTPSINSIDLGGNWSAAKFDLDFATQIAPLTFQDGLPSGVPGPALYRGTLQLAAAPTDTYLTLCGWGKGQFFINGVHVGRYWAASGPQYSYYIPAALLQIGDNDIVVFEMADTPPLNASVAFVTDPDFTGKVCGLTHSPITSSPLSPPLSTRASSSSAASVSSLLHGRAVSSSSLSSSSSTCSGSPSSNANISLQTCDTSSTPNSFQEWIFDVVSGDAGVIRLASMPSQCWTQVDKNPDTGEVNIGLGVCDVLDTSQHWLPFPRNGNGWLNPVTGKCLDAAGGGSSIGTRLETYDCTGGDNQNWQVKDAVTSSTVFIYGGVTGLCLAACI